MTALSNLLKLRNLLNPLFKINHASVRCLFEQSVLNLDRFVEAKQKMQDRLGPNRALFFKMMADNVDNKQSIFTKDFRNLILLTETDEEYQLMLRVRELYKEQQRRAAFPGHFRNASYILRMLYVNNKVSAAYEWFQDERSTIEHDAANIDCFVIMMDMLYEAGRYDDVISLMANVEVYMNTPSAVIYTLYFAALFKKNTKTALDQAKSKLQDFCEKECPLPNRCYFFSALLAYNQRDYKTIMELGELPIFYLVTAVSFSKAENVQILALIGLGRLEECLSALNSTTINMEETKPQIFPDVIDKLSEALEKEGSVEMKEGFHRIKKTLVNSKLIVPMTLNHFTCRSISIGEYLGMKELYLKKSNLLNKGFARRQHIELVE